MKIVNIETYLVGNPWKNWLFVQVHTDEGIVGTGEGSLGHLSKTVKLPSTKSSRSSWAWKFSRPNYW